MHNHITLIGRLVKDLEIKDYESNKFYQFRMAHNVNKDKSFFITVTVGKLPDFMVKTLTKGTKVLVSGKLDLVRLKDNSTFAKIKGYEVELLDHKSYNSNTGGQPVKKYNKNNNNNEEDGHHTLDDTPF